MSNMKSMQIQKMVAASVDELLEIVEGVNNDGKEGWDSISLKRRILLERCKRLEERLKEAQNGLRSADGTTPEKEV